MNSQIESNNNILYCYSSTIREPKKLYEQDIMAHFKFLLITKQSNCDVSWISSWYEILFGPAPLAATKTITNDSLDGVQGKWTNKCKQYGPLSIWSRHKNIKLIKIRVWKQHTVVDMPIHIGSDKRRRRATNDITRISCSKRQNFVLNSFRCMPTHALHDIDSRNGNCAPKWPDS